MSEAVVASTKPIFAQVEENKTYFWCSCGLSKKQPFCDGSHSTTDFKPVKYTADKTRKVGFCGCKHTKNAPLCDGSHSKL